MPVRHKGDADARAALRGRHRAAAAAGRHVCVPVCHARLRQLLLVLHRPACARPPWLGQGMSVAPVRVCCLYGSSVRCRLCWAQRSRVCAWAPATACAHRGAARQVRGRERSRPLASILAEARPPGSSVSGPAGLPARHAVCLRHWLTCPGPGHVVRLSHRAAGAIRDARCPPAGRWRRCRARA